MSVLRWKITDPYDVSSLTNTYVFPRNPSEMTSPYPDRSITPQTTSAGKVLMFEGATTPKQWTFSGPILEKQQFLDLQTWVYTKNRRLDLTDHFGRVISCVFTSVEMTPKRRVNYYYSHDYVVTALALKVGVATVGVLGP